MRASLRQATYSGISRTAKRPLLSTQRRWHCRRPASATGDAPSTSSSSSSRSPLSSNDDDGSSSSSLSIHVADTGAPREPAPSADSSAAQLELMVREANEATEAENRVDIYKAIGISAAVSILAGILDHQWVEDHQALSMTLLFCLGYAGIMVEEVIGLNKAGVALLMAVSMWTIRSTSGDSTMLTEVNSEVTAALASVSELIFFLLGAMTVVEVVDCHGGFKRLASWVRADSRATLACFVAVLTFLMSAVLDNLTSTIVCISILQRAVPSDAELRKVLGAVVVVAANAGGAWTPIGDVTTTMLWIHGQITAVPTMRDLLLPSAVSLAVPLGLLCATSPALQGPVTKQQQQQQQQQQQLVQPAASASSSSSSSSSSAGSQQEPLELKSSNRDILVLSVGLGALLFVPVFKQLTGLPPYLGILSGLAVLWLVTDALHFGEDRSFPRVQDALRNLDIAGVMFFLGVLMSVEALDAAGLLARLAEALAQLVPNIDIVAGSIGIVSSLIDNVPLVAATMGMYDLAAVPPDSQLWQLIALCAGTGGSLLVIGSAAGVAYMGLEGGVSFGWYAKRISPCVLAGYVAAIGTYIVLHGLPSSAAAAAAVAAVGG